MAITALPTLDRLSPGFKAATDLFFGTQLALFSVQAEAARVEINANATDAAASAGAAETSKNAAATSEVNAATSAAQAAATAGAPLWVTGTAYTLFAKRTSTVNGLIYNRIVAGAGAVDPALDTVNWAPLALPLPPQLLFSIGVI